MWFGMGMFVTSGSMFEPAELGVGMSLPPFYEFGLPILQELVGTPAGMPKKLLYERIAARMQLNESDLADTIPSGQSMFENRVGWALSYMKKAGWVDNPSRAFWKIALGGQNRAKSGNPIRLNEFGPLKLESVGPGASPTQKELLEPSLTPRERIDAARAEIIADIESTILQRLGTLSPKRFEQVVLALLAKMGYAGNLGTSEHVGGSGDGGIDGILYLDRLRLERVYVQAKRWQGTVGEEPVRSFAGAMDLGANKGVILTTSTFTPAARKYVEKSHKAIRLVEGRELAALMVESEVGVQAEVIVRVPKVDEDFFEEA